MLDDSTLQYYFSLTHELLDVEFKGAGKRGDNPLFGRVVRAAIAMANRRDGGTIIIGVADLNANLRLDGLTPKQLETWKYEEIANGLNSYTSSHIEFERQQYEQDGKSFLVLSIHELASVPVMCIKEYRDGSNERMLYKERTIILREGAF
jgi:predicted HTH transcriptional regulator